MTSHDLAKKLLKLPNHEVGMKTNDMDTGDSDSVYFVCLLDDSDVDNDSGILKHKIVISG